MKLSDFDYDLPKSRIAQRPSEQRDLSKLLVIRRQDGHIEETVFSDIGRFLEPGDVLVVNNTVVMPMRLTGKKESGAVIEVTLTARLSDDEWECMIRGKKPGPGTKIFFPRGASAEIMGQTGSEVRTDAEAGAPLWKIKTEGDFESELEASGLPALPPYIKREPGDDPAPDIIRYQTVYAKEGEAAAAPTAGLHFTPELIEELEKKGVGTAEIRLDVSYGTFAPVRTETVEDHRMHPEAFYLTEESAAKINHARENGGRVVAVGTTSVRTLEHQAGDDGRLTAGHGETSLYIYPGYAFRAVDAMVTNFHMPKSTLIILVAAFAGEALVKKAYEYALSHDFRFLSYGDAMLIL